MEQIIKLNGLGCANCAAKMEHKVGKLKEIDEVAVNFMSAKMHLEVAAYTPELHEKVTKIVKKIENYVELEVI